MLIDQERMGMIMRAKTHPRQLGIPLSVGAGTLSPVAPSILRKRHPCSFTMPWVIGVIVACNAVAKETLLNL